MSSPSASRAFFRNIEQVARGCDWPIDAREHNRVGFYFNGGALVHRRTVWVFEDDLLDSIVTFCACRLDPDDMPDGLYRFLLERNEELDFGSWQCGLFKGQMTFSITTFLQIEGLRPARFKAVCGKLVNEAAALDAVFHKRGLFRT
ncbi:type III secretion system chaperone family protein [Zavarzinella formosa]|uniref:hypothetical protein n=1 Tax=Zavarzinella formosa TaxID=360055 RepID=UPI0003715424|nr:hypothetical protein [Zavarzinella formosa]